MIYVLLFALAAGATIPVDPHYIILDAPRIVRNTGTCIQVITQGKVYRCDRVFAGGFQ